MAFINCQFPRLNCSNFPITAGRPQGQPTGIVVHYLEEDMATLAGTQAAANKKLLRGRLPRGYHFLVEHDGTSLMLQFPADTVPNLHNTNQPTTAALALIGNAANPDPFVIHVGLTSVQNPCNPLTANQYLEFVRVICCLTQQFPQIAPNALHIFMNCAFRADLCDECSGTDMQPVLPVGLFADVENCQAGGLPGGAECVPDPCDPCDPGTIRIREPECCTENRNSIIVIQSQIATIATQIVNLTNTVNAFDARIDALEAFRIVIEPQIAAFSAQVPALFEQVQSIRTYLTSIQHCLACLCPADISRGTIEYILQEEQDRIIVPPNTTGSTALSRIVNFADRVTDFTPDVVQAGPLWSVDLPGGNYDSEVEVRFAPTERCGGCIFWLDLVMCGSRIRLVTQPQADGIAVVTLNWADTISITTPCPDLHWEVGTDCNIGTPAYKVIEYARVRITTI